jgi:hypothetical protein
MEDESRAWSVHMRPGTHLPSGSVLSECTAIGYTAKGEEKWGQSLQDIHVECVGIPPYPGTRHPRIVGLVSPRLATESSSNSIIYLSGSAVDTRGKGSRIIAHIVNDATANWGGGGFAVAVKRKWQDVQSDFRSWAEGPPRALRLGNVRFYSPEKDITIASMVCQKGYGPSAKPRVRYAALQDALRLISEEAIRREATVHMPRIGTGNAGGSWDIIQDLISSSLLSSGVSVFVYSLPGSELPEPAQRTLNFTTS